MTLPRPLVLFLAFCGGGALFAMPLLMAALALGTPASPAAAADSPTPQPSVTTGTDEVLGTLTFHAFDLGFDPAGIEVDQPGRYAISFVNDGAILHNITFADGTVLEADGGKTAKGEVVVPADGLAYVCAIPGHTEAGMQGAITVAGGHRSTTRTPVQRHPRQRTRPCSRIRMRRSTRRATPRLRQWPAARCTRSTWW